MRVGIIGGGISGLSCAWYLKRAGVDAVVFDPAPGGPIGTVTIQNCILETGPDSWLAAKPWAEELIRELGLGDQIIGSNDAQRRTYLLRHGRFVPMPDGLQMVVPTKIWPMVETRLLGWETKLHMGGEIFRSPKTMPDRTVSEFVTDHFGREAVDYLAEPLLAGVYGGSPDQLSAPSVLPKFVEYEQRFGSVVVGTLRDRRKFSKGKSGGTIFKSMAKGLGGLIDALRAHTTILPFNADSISLDPHSLIWTVNAGGESHTFNQLVLACGARASAPLVAPFDARAEVLLKSIPYSGSCVWSLGYRREDIKHPLDAFGFLVPKPERGAVMACTWVATKWLGRIPADKAVLRCFSTEPGITEAAVREDLQRLMGITAEPLFAHCNEWPNSMPQYTVGHTVRVTELMALVAMIPGLHLAGNAYHGIGLPDCVKSGKHAAEMIRKSLPA